MMKARVQIILYFFFGITIAFRCVHLLKNLRLIMHEARYLKAIPVVDTISRTQAQ
jgi:hypothetical protein